MNAIERSHRALALHREKSASRRALVEFSISLRWTPAFRQRIEELRERWELDPDGEDYPGPDANGREPLPPSIEAHRDPDDGTIRRPGLALYKAYMKDTGAIIEEFAPLDRFPPYFWDEEAPEFNRWNLATTHALSWFVRACLFYRIEDLPAAEFIPGLGNYSAPLTEDPEEGRYTTQEPTGWLLVRIPREATREEAYRLVDIAFTSLDYAHGEQRRQPRRDVEDVERTYQTWRLLREWGGSYRKAAGELVRLGFDERRPSTATMSKRVKTAVKDWSLPPIKAPPE